MGVAHLAFDLGPWREGRHRVDDHHVERTRTDQHVADLERLLARVGLGDEQLVDVDADGPGVDRVHGVLGVDVGADAAVALGLGHDVHREGGLARGLGTVELGDTAPGQAPDAERHQRERRPWSRLVWPWCPSAHLMTGKGPFPTALVWLRAMRGSSCRSTVLSFCGGADVREARPCAGPVRAAGTEAPDRNADPKTWCDTFGDPRPQHASDFETT